ncbi:MAG TPA: proton-conducting transporter membrane subunit [Candidatus Acidoferrum sp.]|nr:proton-conducting transporter membrane subunit [Candidatus Acidoferrum sp.]
MTLILTLILLPLATGLVLLGLKPNLPRQILVSAVVLAVCVGSVVLALQPTPLKLGELPLSQHGIDQVLFLVEVAISLFILYVGIRAKHLLIVLLALATTGLMVWFELTAGEHLEVAQNLYVDKFAVIMALINGIVGGGICLYALGYMREYHEVAHRDVRDRRPLFFALLFIFMGAMFGLIFANNLVWLFLFWEITTLCSFLLIGYTQTEEAKRNALRALVMNLAGGLAFAVAIVWFHRQTGSVEMQKLIASKQSLVLLPAALLCFAGITKSAQLPFSSWLLGAMVAPTPVSALLHSSTMVKAGVYLVLRMAPAVTGTRVGLMVALVGAVTFVIGSLAAITSSEAKRVLAWSTVANLGLIVLCGGIGTYEAVWAGILLIIFHAVAKCLLFLCVGVVEHKLHSRNIEDMSGLVVRMPKVAIMMQIGMAGMFLAPFGMLISKWAVLKAVVDAYPVLSVFIAFGSAATLFFWVKWMGKLIEVVAPHERIKKELVLGEAIALYGLSAGTALACLMFPLISIRFIEPYIYEVFGRSASLGETNVMIMTAMMGLVMVFPVCFMGYGRGVKVVDAYLGGANVQSSVKFRSTADSVQEVAIGNYYLHNLFTEAGLSRWGVISCTTLLVMLVAVAIL